MLGWQWEGQVDTGWWLGRQGKLEAASPSAFISCLKGHRWGTSCEPISIAVWVLTSSYYSFPSPWALSESLGGLWFPNLYFWLGGSSFLS